MSLMIKLQIKKIYQNLQNENKLNEPQNQYKINKKQIKKNLLENRRSLLVKNL